MASPLQVASLLEFSALCCHTVLGVSSDFGTDTRRLLSFHQKAIRMTSQLRRRSGFTLVELLVVIAIIGVLVALLLPAAQMAREAARRVQCQNHLKQSSLAFLQLESAQGHFPTGGWGFKWTGDPDRGFGPGQPGGWGFSILPYLEEGNAASIGEGLGDTAKAQALIEQKTTIIAGLYCPSRRPAELSYGPETSFNAGQPAEDLVAKTDYAVNGGHRAGQGWGRGPQISCLNTYPNCNGFIRNGDPDVIAATYSGVVLPSMVLHSEHIVDGLSKTMLLGEKFLKPAFYNPGVGVNTCSDNNSVYQGFDWDTTRFTDARDDLPAEDTNQNDNCSNRFGSAHRNSFNASYCDGSVHLIEYDIDGDVWEALGRRNDSEQ